MKLWNTLHRQLEDFSPIRDRQVGMYCCGPTVYNPPTIGNFRAYAFEDILKRALRLFGYSVTHVMNITDVGHLVGDRDLGEDKVEREAARQGKTAWDIAHEYEEMFFRDATRLNIIRPDITPRATEHINEQIALVKQLEDKGFTYRTSDGIYFDTSKFAGYGKLSGQKLEDKEAGARVEVNEEKKHATDFALWKFSPTDQKRQMEWESPWGVGFPGWHIECSAMSVKYLGQPFDIHCGGVDHVPVHHENEIAQSEAAFDKPLANYWLHAEFLIVDGRRMGKSEGNAYQIDDLVAKGFDPLALRYCYLTAHYRTKLNFTWEALSAAQNALDGLRNAARALSIGEADRQTVENFRAALEEDLNTPKALAVLWEMIKGDLPADKKGATLIEMDRVLGLGLADIVGQALTVPPEVTALAEQRLAARASKDWNRADELRLQIEQLGFSVEDRAGGFEIKKYGGPATGATRS